MMDKTSPFTSNTYVAFRPTHEVAVFAVLNFEITFYRPSTPGFHPRPLLLKYEGHDEN